MKNLSLKQMARASFKARMGGTNINLPDLTTPKNAGHTHQRPVGEKRQERPYLQSKVHKLLAAEKRRILG